MKTVLLFFALLFNQMNAQVVAFGDGAEVRNAEFAGGNDQLSAYLSQNMHYPQPAMVRHVEGAVIVTFTVDTAGAVQNVQIRNGLGHGCDEEAVRLVKAMPKWNPAFFNNKPVASGKTLRIDFRIPRQAPAAAVTVKNF